MVTFTAIAASHARQLRVRVKYAVPEGLPDPGACVLCQDSSLEVSWSLAKWRFHLDQTTLVLRSTFLL